MRSGSSITAHRELAWAPEAFLAPHWLLVPRGDEEPLGRAKVRGHGPGLLGSAVTGHRGSPWGCGGTSTTLATVAGTSPRTVPSPAPASPPLQTHPHYLAHAHCFLAFSLQSGVKHTVNFSRFSQIALSNHCLYNHVIKSNLQGNVYHFHL